MEGPGLLIPGTGIPARPPPLTCTCGQATRCSLTDCPQPWAVAYRKRVRLRWWERAASILLHLMRRWLP